MKNKQELGPRQLKWVEALEAHPERQTQQTLGTREKEYLKEHFEKTGVKIPYLACCLGEACVVKNKIQKKTSVFNSYDVIEAGSGCKTFLSLSEVNYFGFYDEEGLILEKYRFKKYLGKYLNGKIYDKLSLANDKGATWLQIAFFVRKYPQAVFKESK